MNQEFVYNKSAITFSREEGKSFMVNATEMAKPFDKLPSGWLRNQSSQEFINELSAIRNSRPEDMVLVKNGGVDFGTWMHEDVALEFARWLSPVFAIWCNDRIKELLLTGSTQADKKLGPAMKIVPRNKVKVSDRNIELLRSLAYLEEGACRPFHCDNVLDRILADYARNNVGKVEEAYQTYRKSLTYTINTED